MFRRILLLCLGLVALCPLVQAGQLVMKNGDRISGTIEHVRDGKAAVQTPYAGLVEIDLDAVQSMETDAPLFVKDAEGEVMQRRLAFDDGQWYAADDDAREAIDPPVIAARQAEAVTPPAPKVWEGTVEAAGSWRSGQTDVIDAVLKVAAARQFDKDRLSLAASAGYGKVDGELNTRRLKGEARYQHYPNDRWYVFIVAGLEHDKPRKLELRATGAVGLGYDFIDRERLKLSGDAGVEYAYERWKRYSDAELDAIRRARREATYSQTTALFDAIQADELSLERAFAAARAVRLASRDIDNTRIERAASLRLALHYKQTIFEQAALTATLTAWPELEDLGNYRALSELGFSTPLTDTLNLRLSLTSEYKSAPPQNVEQWDHLLQTGIVYRF